jgi:hypothetical protein
MAAGEGRMRPKKYLNNIRDEKPESLIKVL